jgi:hypothetical protein
MTVAYRASDAVMQLYGERTNPALYSRFGWPMYIRLAHIAWPFTAKKLPSPRQRWGQLLFPKDLVAFFVMRRRERRCHCRPLRG